MRTKGWEMTLKRCIDNLRETQNDHRVAQNDHKGMQINLKEMQNDLKDTQNNYEETLNNYRLLLLLSRRGGGYFICMCLGDYCLLICDNCNTDC